MTDLESVKYGGCWYVMIYDGVAISCHFNLSFYHLALGGHPLTYNGAVCRGGLEEIFGLGKPIGTSRHGVNSERVKQFTAEIFLPLQPDHADG